MVETPDGGMHLDPSLATYAIQDENKVLQSICDCIVSMASSQEMPSVSAITDEKDDVEGQDGRAVEGGEGPSVSRLSEVPMQGDSVRVAEVGHGARAPPGSSGRKDLPVVIESELKARMGFRLLHGHREWRKYKVSNGLISSHCRLKGLEYGYLETLLMPETDIPPFCSSGPTGVSRLHRVIPGTCQWKGSCLHPTAQGR